MLSDQASNLLNYRQVSSFEGNVILRRQPYRREHIGKHWIFTWLRTQRVQKRTHPTMPGSCGRFFHAVTSAHTAPRTLVTSPDNREWPDTAEREGVRTKAINTLPANMLVSTLDNTMRYQLSHPCSLHDVSDNISFLTVFTKRACAAMER